MDVFLHGSFADRFIFRKRRRTPTVEAPLMWKGIVHSSSRKCKAPSSHEDSRKTTAHEEIGTTGGPLPTASPRPAGRCWLAAGGGALPTPGALSLAYFTSHDNPSPTLEKRMRPT